MKTLSPYMVSFISLVVGFMVGFVTHIIFKHFEKSEKETEQGLTDKQLLQIAELVKMFKYGNYGWSKEFLDSGKVQGQTENK